MRGLDRYIFKQIALGTFAVTVAITFAVWLAQSLRYIDYLVNRGLPFGTFMELTLLLLPSFWSVALPIAAFVSTLFIMQKATQDSEIVILRAAGMSPLRVLRPVLMLGLLVTLLVYSITVYFQPYSLRQFRVIQLQIRQDFISVFIQEGVFNTLGDAVTVFVRSRDESGELHGILAHDARDPKHPSTLMAESGALIRTDDGPRIVLINGLRQEKGDTPGELSALAFDRYTLDISLGNAAGPSVVFEERERYLNELFDPPDVAKLQQKTLDEFYIEGHGRLSNPLVGLAMVMIAGACVLVGEYSRRGNQLRMGIGIAAASGVMALQLAAQDMATRNFSLIPLLYLLPLGATLAALLILARRPRRRPRELQARTAS